MSILLFLWFSQRSRQSQADGSFAVLDFEVPDYLLLRTLECWCSRPSKGALNFWRPGFSVLNLLLGGQVAKREMKSTPLMPAEYSSLSLPALARLPRHLENVDIILWCDL
jgi:hypothetical protein